MVAFNDGFKYREAMSSISISKDANNELPIPAVWRTGLKRLADTFVSNDLVAVDEYVSIVQIDAETSKINLSNIEDYPDKLGLLTEKSWNTSVCIWVSDHWDVLVDLSNEDGETTDLVLHASVRENGEKFVVEPGLIYVP